MHKTWQWFLKEWMDKNEKMHGINVVAKERKVRETAIRKARWLHNLREKVMPRHHDMFCSSVKEHCKDMTTNQLIK